MLLKYIFAMSSNLVVLIVIKCPFDTLSQLLVNYILSIYTVKLPKSRFAGSNGYSPFFGRNKIVHYLRNKIRFIVWLLNKTHCSIFYNTMCRMERNILGYIGNDDHCMIHFDKNEMKNKKPNAEK